MNIVLTGTHIEQDTTQLGFQKNNLIDMLVVTVDTDESWQYKLDVRYTQKDSKGEEMFNVIDLNRSGQICTALLTLTMLPLCGKYTMQLRGIKGQQVWHSDTFYAWVNYSIDPGDAYNPVPSEFYQVEYNITELNNHPPYPDISGFWMIWDVNEHKYKLSDIPVPTDGGMDKTFEFTQSTPSNVWVIRHGLYKHPSVTVTDSGGNEVVGEVEYIDMNVVKVTFASVFSGKAYLN